MMAISRTHIAAPLLALSVLFMGGCAAIIPTILSTAGSFVVPKSVSLAFTGLRTLHKVALMAADERSVKDMAGDKVLSIKASANLLATSGTDVEAYAYNGDIYVVGEVDDMETRDQVIGDLRSIKGVSDVKGVLKIKPQDDYLPNVSDSYLSNMVQLALTRKLHIRSANVEAEACQGEIYIMGVVADKQEELEIMEYVRGLTERRVHSLMALQNEYENGMLASNHQFILYESGQGQPGSDPAAPDRSMLAGNEVGPSSGLMAENELERLNGGPDQDDEFIGLNPPFRDLRLVSDELLLRNTAPGIVALKEDS